VKYTDWRLPTIQELFTLVDYSRCKPAMDTSIFSDTQSNYYWSSTTSASYSSHAWVVYFNYGYVDDINKANDLYVRAVRDLNYWDGGAVSTDNSDGTVVDMDTGLIWMKKTLGPCSWYEAQELISKLNGETKE